MRPAWWVALLTAVWGIYTGDHLLDALRTPGPLLTYRHRLHQEHARAITAALVIAILVGLGAAITLRPPLRLFGIGLSVAVITYLASAQRLILASLPKEPVAGALYAAGIWGGPLLVGASPTTWPLVAALLHGLAAILNLVAMGVFEADVDRGHGSRSLALRIGPENARWWTVRLSLAGTGLSFGLLAAVAGDDRLPFAVLGLQIALQGAMLFTPAWFAEEERYRVWGDSVFLLGALPRLIG
ncbi:MAG: hypothetical protein JJE39_12350 [Vicinamibacteria bacterium]|nr:hypothetical protein [Vicinamibacteria bacterium]